MTNIVPFSFENKEIRVLMIDGEPWFVSTDIAKVLEHSNSRSLCDPVPKKWKGVKKVYTLGGEQEVLCLNESGLYKVIMRSNKPKAQFFQDWVCEEVLPSIRKSGKYDSTQNSPQSALEIAIAMNQQIMLVLESQQALEKKQKELEQSVAFCRSKTEHLSESVESQERWLTGIDAELDRIQSSEGHYFTVIGYANLRSLSIGKQHANNLGRKASAYCRKNGLRKEEVFDSMFGKIGNYPQEALEFVFQSEGLI